MYVDAKRIATYTAGPTARAHMVGTQGDITADTIQLFMKPGASELDRAEAHDVHPPVEQHRLAAVGRQVVPFTRIGRHVVVDVG